MKKKLLILSAAIGLVLACFPFTLCAEEDPQSDLGISSPSEIPLLDSYFYDNYDLLPYIESDYHQYIDTDINGDSNLKIDARFQVNETNGNNFIFGCISSANGSIGAYITTVNNNERQAIVYQTNYWTYAYDLLPYQIINFTLDKNLSYFNGQLIHTFLDNTFDTGLDIYIFGRNNNGSGVNAQSNIKLYSFSIYDYDADSGNGDYVRYYYPAKAKSGGTIGLYDAVSKTFFTTGGSDPFENPTDDYVLDFQISDFITAGLGWIGDILDFAISEPLIICFMAIGLAGAMFRWGRRLVHF